jgi:hypothetical protein
MHAILAFGSDVEIPYASLWRCPYSVKAAERTPRDATLQQKETVFEIFELHFSRQPRVE